MPKPLLQQNKSMHLKILTPEKTQYKGEVKSVNIKTLAGEITILDGHEPLISMFEVGPVNIIDKNDQKHLVEIKSGCLEITPDNELNVLTE